MHNSAENRINQIVCKKPFMMVALNVLFVLLWIILIDSNVILWVVVILIVLQAWTQFPDLVLSDDGIEILRWGRRTFLSWDEVSNVTVGSFYFRVYPKMPLVARIFFVGSFLIPSWYSNYKEALEYIETQLASD